MRKSEKVNEFSRRAYELTNELEELNKEMLVFAAKQDEAKMVLKGWRKVKKHCAYLSAELNEMVGNMRQNVECYIGEYEG